MYRNVNELLCSEFNRTRSVELRDDQKVEECLANKGDLLVESSLRDSSRSSRHGGEIQKGSLEIFKAKLKGDQVDKGVNKF